MADQTEDDVLEPERCLRCYGNGEIVCPTTAGPSGGVGGMTLTMFTCPECGGTGLRHSIDRTDA